MVMMRNVCGYLATRDARTVFSEQEDSPHVCFAFHRSDADPQVLADFMCALLQADATEDVLFSRCVNELSVFLEDSK